jgi:hypothetical protein
LESRWRTLTPAEKTQAEVLLGDASNLIVSECKYANVVPDGDQYEYDLRADTLERITCSMVKRSMMVSVDQVPMTQMSITAGPFGQSGTLANPMGDLYLTKSERKSLPCGQQSAFTVPMWDLEPVLAGSINDPEWDPMDHLSNEPHVPLTIFPPVDSVVPPPDLS